MGIGKVWALLLFFFLFPLELQILKFCSFVTIFLFFVLFFFLLDLCFKCILTFRLQIPRIKKRVPCVCCVCVFPGLRREEWGGGLWQYGGRVRFSSWSKNQPSLFFDYTQVLGECVTKIMNCLIRDSTCSGLGPFSAKVVFFFNSWCMVGGGEELKLRKCMSI